MIESDSENEIDVALTRFIEALDAKLKPDPAEWAMEYPSNLRSRIQEKCADLLAAHQVIFAAGEMAGMPDPHLGRTYGDFQIKRMVGRGGMGVVYEARHAQLNRQAAIKFLAPSHLGSKDHLKRFFREARTMADVDHPGIARVFEVGEAFGEPFIAMEFVKGKNLAEELKDLRNKNLSEQGSKEGVPEPRTSHAARTARICSQVAHALHSAHEKEVVHRDIKPSNILLDQDDNPRIIDFGLAQNNTLLSLSTTKQVVGTPSYMSPEQASCSRVDAEKAKELADQVDHRTDIYSLGVVLYELLSGRRPFEKGGPEHILHSILNRDPQSVRCLNDQIPRDLEAICLMAMERNPERRYQTALSMSEDLDRFVHHQATIARPLSAWQSLIRTARNQKRKVATAVGAVAAAILLVGFTLFLSQRERVDERLGKLTADFRRVSLDLLSDNELRELRSSSLDILIADETKAEVIGEEVEKEANRRIADARVAAAASMQSVQGSSFEDYRFESDYLFYPAVQRLQTLLPLAVDKEQVEEFLAGEPGFCRLRVDSNPSGAQVIIRPVNWRTGEYLPGRVIGQTPLIGGKVVPGYYRIVLSNGDGSFSEITRWFSIRGRVIDLGVVPLSAPDADTTKGMRLISGAEFETGVGGALVQYPIETKTIPDFYLDETEVTNEAYRLFARATERPLPSWMDEDYSSQWDNYPVAGVNAIDARAYAEWTGKRLPTHNEWERAARGRQGRKFLRGHNAIAASQGVLVDALEDGESGNLAAYLRAMKPVGSHPNDLTEDGIYDLVGSLTEWTETVPIGEYLGDFYPLYTQRIVKGADWTSPRFQAALQKIGFTPASAKQHFLDFGFRCAKSVRP